MSRILITVLAAILGACAASEAAEQAAGPIVHERTVGAVTVVATFDPGLPDTIELAFDTHTVDLGFDVNATTTLTIDGVEVADAWWNGSEPGGHHRFGTITLPVIPLPGEEIVLTFTGLGEPVVFGWSRPG